MAGRAKRKAALEAGPSSSREESSTSPSKTDRRQKGKQPTFKPLDPSAFQDEGMPNVRVGIGVEGSGSSAQSLEILESGGRYFEVKRSGRIRSASEKTSTSPEKHDDGRGSASPAKKASGGGVKKDPSWNKRKRASEDDDSEDELATAAVTGPSRRTGPAAGPSSSTATQHPSGLEATKAKLRRPGRPPRKGKDKAAGNGEGATESGPFRSLIHVHEPTEMQAAPETSTPKRPRRSTTKEESGPFRSLKHVNTPDRRPPTRTSPRKKEKEPPEPLTHLASSLEQLCGSSDLSSAPASPTTPRCQRSDPIESPNSNAPPPRPRELEPDLGFLEQMRARFPPRNSGEPSELSVPASEAPIADVLVGLNEDECTVVECAQDPEELCQICQQPLALTQSTESHVLRAKLQKARWKKIKPVDSARWCALHYIDIRVIPLAQYRGYPERVEWSQLWRGLETSWIRRRVRRLFLNPRSSPLYRFHAASIDSVGKSKWKASLNEPPMVMNASTGYYGDVGTEMIRAYLKDLIAWGCVSFDPRVLGHFSPKDFLDRVLIPECANMLIAADQPDSANLDGKALDEVWNKVDKIRKQGIEYGRYLLDGVDSSDQMRLYLKDKSERERVVRANWAQDREERRKAAEEKKQKKAKAVASQSSQDDGPDLPDSGEVIDITASLPTPAAQSPPLEAYQDTVTSPLPTTSQDASPSTEAPNEDHHQPDLDADQTTPTQASSPPQPRTKRSRKPRTKRGQETSRTSTPVDPQPNTLLSVPANGTGGSGTVSIGSEIVAVPSQGEIVAEQADAKADSQDAFGLDLDMLGSQDLEDIDKAVNQPVKV